MPTLRLTEDAQQMLINYHWKGNVRQLKNITEQIAIIEKERTIDTEILARYLPTEINNNRLPILFKDPKNSHLSERDLLYKVLFEMRRDITDLKQLVGEIMQNDDLSRHIASSDSRIVDIFNGKEYSDNLNDFSNPNFNIQSEKPQIIRDEYEGPIQDSEVVEESLSIQDKEIELIKRALKKHNGKRKVAADELGISERTLYRKIKEYNIS